MPIFSKILFVVAIYFISAGSALSQGSQLNDYLFADEQAALNAYNLNPNNLNATVLSMLRNRYAEYFYGEFKNDSNPDSLGQSLKYLELAQEVLPNNEPSVKLKAAIFYDLRAIPAFRVEAIEAFADVVRFVPNELTLRILHLNFLMELSLWQLAIEEAESIYNLNPDFSRDTIIDRMIAGYINAGWPYRGIGFFDQQLTTAPNDPSLLIAMAILQRRVTDVEAAETSLGAVLLNPSASSKQREIVRELQAHWAVSPAVDDSEYWPD